MTRLLALYPRAWRDRYGAELRSLLDERPPHLADRFDLVRGAFDAHRHPELVTDPRAPSQRLSADDVVVARRLGVAGLAGAAAWAMTWFVVSTSPLIQDPGGAYRDGTGAMPILLLAGVLLAAALCGQLVMLPRSARLARAGAVIAVPGILLWTLVPWYAATEAQSPSSGWASSPTARGSRGPGPGRRRSRFSSWWPRNRSLRTPAPRAVPSAPS